MGFPFLTSKLNLLPRNATKGLIKNAINGVGFKLNYPSPGCQQHSTTRYLKLCPSSSSSFNRLDRVDKVPTGVRLFHEKGNGFNQCEEWIVRFRKCDFKSCIWRFVKNNKIITFSILCMIVFGSVERVPYSNKIHLVFSSDMLERYRGANLWKEVKEANCNLIVDQDNPKAIRAQKILDELLGTMHNGLGLEHGYTINAPILVGSGLSEDKKFFGCQKKLKNRRGRSRFGLKYGTKHLEGLNWEVMLLNVHKFNAFYISTGKIGVNVGAVEGFSDSALAAIIAHEIGHGVARHRGEDLFRFLGYLPALPAGVLGLCFVALLLKKMERFFSRRQELEADHIGLILMASAGYDPRAAPHAYCNDGHKSTLDSTHPSLEKREKMLEKNMEKAVAIYEKVQAGQEVKSFI